MTELQALGHRSGFHPPERVWAVKHQRHDGTWRTDVWARKQDAMVTLRAWRAMGRRAVLLVAEPDWHDAEQERQRRKPEGA